MFLCLDSDTAGSEACTRLAQSIPGEIAVIRLVPARKDWNDVLRQQGDIPSRKFIAETITLRELPTAQPVPMLRMADVELTSVEWLWFPYIPFGKLTIIQGNPGEGKTYQQLAQCKAIYDKHAETILGNMDSVIFLGGREASTIKEISENWLGKATISMQTDSRSRGQSESYSQNNQRLGRELMTPSELATMPGDKCILQLRGLPPFYSPKYDLKKHPNYRYTAEADKKKNAFDLDRLINRRRRPGPDELCEVYAVAVPDDGLTSEDEDILNYDDIDDPDAFA